MSDYLQYGGQAVIEGVMMRSPRFFAVACRKPDGTIIIQEEPIEKSIVGRLKWMNRPMLRGSLALVDAMALGMKAMSFSAKVQAEELDPGSTVSVGADTSEAPGHPVTQSPDNPSTQSPHKHINDIMIGGTMVIALGVGLALFVALPTWLSRYTQGALGVAGSDRRLNIVDGVIRIAIFLGYIGLISLMQNIRRVFQYHGAEHKAINTLESGEDVVIENCLRRSRIHPRCGTSFIVVVLAASILVHTIFPRPDNYLMRLALHIALIPLVAGFAYEVIKLAGRFRSSLPTRVLLAPGLWSQRLTTREPDADQVEVAMAALNAVLTRERETNRPAEPIAAV